MYTWQVEREVKVGRFMNQWGVSAETAIDYLEADEWVYYEACLTYRLDQDKGESDAN